MAENAAVVKESQDTPEDSFESFFLKHYRRVFEVLYRLTGQNAEAEDLTVETFVRYLRRPPAKEDQASGWLYRVAIRLGHNSLRASKRRSKYEEKAALYVAKAELKDPSQEVEQAIKQKKVHAILRRMPRRAAEILVLHHSGFSYKEIAQAVGVSAASVGTLLSRAQRDFERLYLQGG
ncbi:MAG TPA: sigma-70 family RNA polymerase sigma factor [Acidobacteriota bacterium]